MGIKQLEKRIKSRPGKLKELCNIAVPGEGSSHAKIMIVGQNPGKDEEIEGKPFVGKAGKFLNKILNENGIERKNLFITNVVKHKTHRNKIPTKKEIELWKPFLEEEINILKPKIIVLLGGIAEKNTPRLKGIRYIETYHPSAAMRFKEIRIKFEKDIRLLKEEIKKFD
ncbi:MAG: uracil-DNA glycosylase [Parcubacteria group bacterium]|jgi:DNA polymerase